MPACPSRHGSATGKSRGAAVIFKYKNINLAILSQLIIITFLLALPLQAYAQEAPQTAPPVVELFTSKYCPACPPADKNLSNLLEQNPNVIGISCHVTYFDRSNRKDIYSQAFCNARQGIYKAALQTPGIYTPMAIVNGQKVIDARSAKAMTNSATATKHQPVGMRLNGAYLDIQLPEIVLNKKADVWLVTMEKSAKAANKPTSYHRYQNAATDMKKLLRWDGKATNMAYPVKDDANTRYAVLVQTYQGGILAAGQTP